MARGIIIIALLLAACGKEPDFDQRYAEAERRIEARAAAMERDLAAQDRPAEAPDK